MPANLIYQHLHRPATFISSPISTFKYILNSLLMISILGGAMLHPSQTIKADTQPDLHGGVQKAQALSSKGETIFAPNLTQPLRLSSFLQPRTLPSSSNLQSPSGSGTFWLNFYDGSPRPLHLTFEDGQVDQQAGTLDGYGIIAIASVPGQPDIAYYLTSLNQVWKTIDGGGTFTLLTGLAITDGQAKDIFVNPANPQEIYVFRIWDKNWNEHYGYLHFSSDGGRTWGAIQLPDVLIRSGEASALMNSKGTIVVIVQSGKGTSCRGEYNAVVWRSADKGVTWQNVWQTCNDPTYGLFGQAHSLAYSQNNPSVWYATVNASFGDPYYQGVIRSSDDGIS